MVAASLILTAPPTPPSPAEPPTDGLSPRSSAFKLEEDDAPIKRCPKCKVYIERDEGCAQMMCKNCKHAFCWYCLESLDVSTAPSSALHFSLGGGEHTSHFLKSFGSASGNRRKVGCFSVLMEMRIHQCRDGRSSLKQKVSSRLGFSPGGWGLRAAGLVCGDGLGSACCHRTPETGS